MTLVFFGNTKYSTIGLKIVNSTYPISLIVTIPESPVKKMAEDLNIQSLETNKLDQKSIEQISLLNPDFF